MLAGAAVPAAVVLAVASSSGLAPVQAAAACALGLVPGGLAVASVARRNPPAVSAADRVTLTRTVLVGGCTSAAVLALTGATPARTWLLVALAVPALLLDLVDGFVARRTGTVSAAGARLDMEVDAGLLLVLSAAVVPVVGAWALLVGAMRYLFVAASGVRPALRAPLAYSTFRRTVAGVQGGVLAGALAPVVPPALAAVAVAGALAALAVSFGRDVVHLERRARHNAALQVERAPHGR